MNSILIQKTEPINRFKIKIVKDVVTGCWIWTGSRCADGYGRFGNGEKTVITHRWSYEHFIGPVPKGLTIDHLCRNRACVNPKHLDPVTIGENLLRGSYYNKKKTHCRNGHEFNLENTYVWNADRGTSRYCRICRNKQQKEFNKRRKKLQGV